jgi:hypothetical protein
MTKEKLIDLIYLKAVGWKPSNDQEISRPAIAAMLPLLLSDAINAFQQETRRAQFEELRMYGASSGETVNTQFLTTLTVTPEKDTDTDYYYVDLPKRVAILPFSRGINDLRPKKGTGYVRVRSFREISGIEKYLTAYWFDTIDSTQKLFISNIGTPVCEHYLSIVVDFDDLEDTDEVYLPPGFNAFIIKEAHNYIMGEQPEYKIDYKEDQ